MKKVGLFLLSLILAFITVEFFFQFVVGFPTYEVDKKLTGIRGAFSGTQNVFKPKSSYFTVEGGLKIFRRNNLGFTGLDVDTSMGTRYIAVLGNSFVEAYQVPPESTAVGILQRRLREEQSEFEVINLGVSGHDPMDLLYRLDYYNKTYHFDKIILVITSSQEGWLNRHQKLLFEPMPVSTNESLMSRVMLPLRNSSVLVDLLVKFMKSNEAISDDEKTTKQPAPKTQRSDAHYSKMLIKVLSEYDRLYHGKFSILNISNLELEAVPTAVEDYIQQKKIKYKWEPIVKSDNMIGGNGHLNLKGNLYLGRALNELLR